MSTISTISDILAQCGYSISLDTPILEAQLSNQVANSGAIITGLQVISTTARTVSVSAGYALLTNNTIVYQNAVTISLDSIYSYYQFNSLLTTSQVFVCLDYSNYQPNTNFPVNIVFVDASVYNSNQLLFLGSLQLQYGNITQVLSTTVIQNVTFQVTNVCNILTNLLQQPPVSTPQIEASGSCVTFSLSGTSGVTLNHNLGTMAVFCKVFDSNQEEIIPNSLQVVNTNTISLTFSPSFTGTVIISSCITNCKTFSLSNVSNITLTHNLNTTGIFYRLLNTNYQQVLPNSFQIIDNNNITFTFSPAFTGTAILTGCSSITAGTI